MELKDIISIFASSSVSYNDFLRKVARTVEKCSSVLIKGKNKKYEWLLIDEFSGYIMTKPLSSALVNKGVISMREFINDYKNVVFSKS